MMIGITKRRLCYIIFLSVCQISLMGRLPPPAFSLCLSFCIQVILLPCGGSSAPPFGNETDRLALFAFKDGITHDPLRVMSSWNDSVHFCEWIGVTCSLSGQRVVNLSLGSQELGGTISPSAGNLSFLTAINLGNNKLIGEIPEQLGHLSQLQHLNLSYNFLEGKIPLNLTQCVNLTVLSVLSNDLTGYIPYQLSNLKKLTFFALGRNNLLGVIPPWIGNFSSLFFLSLSRNNFHGDIPSDLGRLSRLGFFSVFDNMLSGEIPPSLYNISSIYYLTVAKNQLHGRLPPDVGLTLPDLEVFAGAINNFHGPIPDSLSNASRLQVLDFPDNGFTGSVPVNLGRIKSLARLNFGGNHLGSEQATDLNIITFLVNCTSLKLLGLEYNRLQGELPHSIANLSSQLDIFTIGGNLIHGSLPVEIENLLNLTLLGLEDNLFSGTIPFGIGKLQKLQQLYLNSNRFAGLIPSSLGNLTQLNSLFMDTNRLHGSMPPSLGNCKNLLVLNISHNNLSGSIPKQILFLSSLSISFTVAHNSLSGSLPLEVGNFINLEELDVSENKLSGEIPATFANCLRLERLRLRGNLFQGTISQSLEGLRGAKVIDLSHNNLSGKVPGFLSNFTSLIYLNLSYNNLEGEVPNYGVFRNASAIIIYGNKKLCGGVKELELPLCNHVPPHTSGSHLSYGVITSIAVGAIFLVLLCFFGAFYWLRNLRKRSGASATSSLRLGDWQLRVSYSDIFKSTMGFSSDCLIGEGSFGSVYKGALCGATYAIKVMHPRNRCASRSFLAECDALRNIRHRNLIKIVTACSSVNFEGNDFKALVYQYMSNGSLEQWLHPNTDNGLQRLKFLSLVQRLNVAVDVASGMEYLHCHCEPSIVHCDLKPSNILLDEYMVAHVSDFGIARFILESTNQNVTSTFRGSIGYIPPEYGTCGQVSVLGDIYSYGILLLEMFTGRRPTDEMFHEGSLYDFVTMATPGHVMEIVDPSLFIGAQEGEEENENESDNILAQTRTEECLVSVIMIGLCCSSPLPRDRMATKDIVRNLNAIRDSFCRVS